MRHPSSGPLAEVVANIKARDHGGEPLARLIHVQQLGHGAAQRARPRIAAGARSLCHGVLQHAGGHRVPLGVVGVQQVVRRCPVDHLGQLPPQVHRVLHTGVEALPADRIVHMRRVASQQYASRPVGRGLPGRVGESGDPGGAVHPVVRSPDVDERAAEITQRRFSGLPGVLLSHYQPYPFPVLQPAQGLSAVAVIANAPLWLLTHLSFCDGQPSRSRLAAPGHSRRPQAA